MGNSRSLLKALSANASRINFSSFSTFSGVGGNGRLVGRAGGGLGADGGARSGGDEASAGGGGAAPVCSEIAAAVAEVVSVVSYSQKSMGNGNCLERMLVAMQPCLLK